MMDWLNTIFEQISSIVWEKHVKEKLKPIFFRDDKVIWKNVKIFIAIFLNGFLFYFLPRLLVILLTHFDLQNANPYFSHLTSDIHYFHAIQYVTSLCYSILILLLLLGWMIKNVDEMASKLVLLEIESKAASFARAVNLVGGSRFSNDAEKFEMTQLIIKKFDESNSIKVMMINWYDDLYEPTSPLLQAITKNCRKDIKVLLLDPFSTFAKQRSEYLLTGEGTDEQKWLKYIHDFTAVKKILSHLNEDHKGNIVHSTFCSRPFFRFYLFDNDLFIQVYHNQHHGRDSPMFHYKMSDDGSIKNDSMFLFSRETFDYYFKNSFSFEPDKLKEKGDSFAAYLAKMYGIGGDGIVNDADGLRAKIIAYVNERTIKAAQKPTQ